MQPERHSFDLGVVGHYLPDLLGGFGLSLLVALAAIVAAVVLGGIVVVLQLSRYRALRWFGHLYVQVFRGVALYVLIIWVYFGLAIALQLSFAPVPAGILTLALLNSAYLAEVFRAGVQGVPAGQSEGGIALGLSPGQVLRAVVAPQAVRSVLPAVGNQFTDVVKDTSILSVIGVGELMFRSQQLAQATFRPFEFYTAAGVLYLLAVLVVSVVFRRLERTGPRGPRLFGLPGTLTARPASPTAPQEVDA